jgi:hypothetical protein
MRLFGLEPTLPCHSCGHHTNQGGHIFFSCRFVAASRRLARQDCGDSSELSGRHRDTTTWRTLARNRASSISVRPSIALHTSRSRSSLFVAMHARGAAAGLCRRRGQRERLRAQIKRTVRIQQPDHVGRGGPTWYIGMSGGPAVIHT